MTRVRRSLSRLAKRLPLAFAWLAVSGALGLLVLEESGILAEVARGAIAWRLGPLGRGLTIERVRLRWFEPGVDLTGVRLAVEESENGGEPARDLLYLRRAHLSLWPGRNGPFQKLHVDGGHICISDSLLDGLRRFSESFAEEPTGLEPRAELRPPPFAVTDFGVDLELPEGEILELGRVGILLAEPAGSGGYALRGRLYPRLGGAVSDRVAIYVDGEQWATGLRLGTTAKALPLASRGVALPASAGALPVDSFSGELTLATEARVEWGSGEVQAAASLRASLRRGRLIATADAPPVEGLTVELDSSFALGPGGGLWDRDSWSTDCRLDGTWRGSPVHARGQFGRLVDDGSWARAWGRIERLPLDEATLDTLRLDERAREVWTALSPDGVADVRAHARLPAPVAGPSGLAWQPPDVALALRLDGRAGMTYVGWPSPEGEAMGVPLRHGDVRGDVLASWTPRAEAPIVCGLVDLRGRTPANTAYASGLVAAVPAGDRPLSALFDLDLSVPDISLDESVQKALASSGLTRRIWEEYQPAGGSLATRWRFHLGADTGGLTAEGTIEARDVALRWNELPVAFEGVAGSVHVSWARNAALVRGLPEHLYRPWGVWYELSNRGAADAPPFLADVRGFARRETLHAHEVGPEELTRPAVSALEIEIDEVLLRSGDWDVLTGRFPVLGARADELGAKGGMRVAFYGGRAAAEAPYRASIEATPRVLELSPRFFQRRAKDIVGRVLVRAETPEDPSAGSFVTRLALLGTWPAGTELGARGTIPSSGPAALQVFGAGVDPTNTAFKGALLETLAEDPRGVQGISDPGRSIGGRLDLVVDTTFVSDDAAAPESTYRIFLRDNTLEADGLSLEELSGVLEQRDDMLQASAVGARLAGHPVELSDVRVFRLGDVQRVPDADPLLGRGSFWTDPQGFALQAELSVEDFPLDERHLRSFVPPETLPLLRASSSRRNGSLSVRNARVVIVNETGASKVAMHGVIRPRALSLRLGLPILVSDANLEVEELIYEAGRLRGWGAISGLSAEIAGREVRDGSMIVTYVDGRLSIDNLSSSFAGGRLQAMGGAGRGTRRALAVSLAEPYRFDLAVRLDGIDVDDLLEGVFQSSIGDRGRLDLGVQLRGTPGTVLGISGSGWLRLDNGRLWSIPVMRELFSTLGMDDTAVFDRLRADFRLRDGQVESNDIKIRSTILSLVGRGKADLEGNLRYDFEVRYSLIDRLGPFNRLLYWFNRNLWRVAVRGDMDRPEIIIRSSIAELFRGFRESRSRELPVPPFASLERRF